MKKKKVVLLVSVILVVGLLSIAYFFFTSEEKKPILPPAKPQIPTYIKGVLPIKITLTENDFDFPSSLPLIAFSVEPISKNSANSIADNLGFEEGQEFKDLNEGVKYYWSNDNGYFIVTPKTGSIKYGLSNTEIPTVQNKQLSNDSLIQIASEFLSNNSIIDKENIKTTIIVPYKENTLSGGLEQTTRATAQLFQINFTYKVSDYEILTIDPSTPLIFVQILPDGSVFNLEAIKLAGVSKKQTLYDLKTYEDVISSTKEIKLISLLNDYINISDITTEDIQSIAVDKIDLVYLLDAYSSKQLQPVFLLEGNVVVTNSTANRALLYLPAIK